MGSVTAEVVDTGERRDERGRRVVPRAQRLALMAAFRASGMTMAKFARREGINYTTFAGWMHREGTAAMNAPIKFTELRMPSASMPSGSLEIRLPDGTVVCGSRVTDLVTLIRALRG